MGLCESYVEIMIMLSYELGIIEPPCAIDCPKHVNVAMH